MPILDAENQFTEPIDSAQGPIIATAVANHVNDSGSSRGRDWATGEPVFPYLRVKQAFNNLTSLQVDIIAADANDLTGNPVVLSTKTILLAALLANTLHYLNALAPGTIRRFLGAKFTVNGIAPSTGTVICGLRSRGAMPQDGVNWM